MAGNNIIITSTDSTVDADTPKVTGTDLPGNKHGMDVSLPSHDPYMDMVNLALQGYQPEPVYDSVERINVSSTQVDYEFDCDGIRQFSVSVTNIDTAYPTVTVNSEATMLVEDADKLLLETGDELLKES